MLKLRVTLMTRDLLLTYVVQICGRYNRSFLICFSNIDLYNIFLYFILNFFGMTNSRYIFSGLIFSMYMDFYDKLYILKNFGYFQILSLIQCFRIFGNISRRLWNNYFESLTTCDLNKRYWTTPKIWKIRPKNINFTSNVYNFRKRIEIFYKLIEPKFSVFRLKIKIKNLWNFHFR